VLPPAPHTKATSTQPAIMYFDPTCDSLGGGNGYSFGVLLQSADNNELAKTSHTRVRRQIKTRS